ncbi:hypothetical protein [Aquimarina sp. 2201CG14-23]|uniref:hypothetical protein n=1 Tax=Aquimarina mycalae TaxID=3040073 RepID=UPI002477FCDA|nr:hypothetical protein [Aquimarina sp. 2201CG14-23]MDH7447605.1 hypothetical protein [Aquimarina sp. 2201CG14-23]
MEINYNNIIKLLNAESKKTIEELRINRTQELVARKKEVDNAITWLKKGMDHQIHPDMNIIMIPEKMTKTPSSEYRLIEDHESDERKYWTEVKLDDQELRPMPGDFLMIKYK